STSAEDVAMRNRLYSRLGAAQARRLLAANFPGGSARSEIRRRVADLADKGDVEKASVSAVINEMVTDMIDSVQKAMLESQGGIDVAAAAKKASEEGPPQPEALAEEAAGGGGADPLDSLDAA